MSSPTGPPGRPDDYGWEAEGGDQPLAGVAFVTDPVGVLRRRWIWMLLVTLLGVVASGVAYRLWTPTYTAAAMVLITSQQIPRDFVRSTVQESTIANMNAMIGEVQSTEKLGAVLDEHDPFPELHDRKPRIEIINRLRSGISIAPDSGQARGRQDTSLIYRVGYEHTDSEKAANVANALARLFVEASTARRHQQAREATRFLQRELERDEAELREQSRRVAEFRREHRGELPEEMDVNLKKLEFLSGERSDIVDGIAEAEERIEALRGGEGIERTRNEVLLEDLRGRLAAELAVHTDEHPNVTSLERRVAQLEARVAAERAGGRALPAEVQRPIEAHEREIERLAKNLESVEAELRETRARVDRTPAVGEQLSALVQKEDVLREDYLGSLRKVQEAERAESLEASQQAAQASILDPARPPGAPQIPAWMVLVGGIGASIVLGLAVGVLLELVDPVIVSAEQLDSVSQKTVLGAIPHFG